MDETLPPQVPQSDEVSLEQAGYQAQELSDADAEERMRHAVATQSATLEAGKKQGKLITRNAVEAAVAIASLAGVGGAMGTVAAAPSPDQSSPTYQQQVEQMQHDANFENQPGVTEAEKEDAMNPAPSPTTPTTIDSPVQSYDVPTPTIPGPKTH